MSNKPVLGYWNVRAMGQPIRLLLAYLEVDYEDRRYTDDETGHNKWFAVDKQQLNLKFPNLPYWIEGDTRVTESRSIMKYLCRTRRPELLGKTVEAQTDIDTIDNFMYDLIYIDFAKLCYEYTDEIRAEYKKKEPVKLGYFNKFLQGKQYVTGDELSYVDFFAYEVLRDLRVYDDKVFNAFPNIQAFVNRVESIPQIKKYMASPAYLEGPIMSKDAILKI